jgi:hypothetical protein
MKMTLRVIGAGFGRTGTMSLKLALEQLGFGPCYHMVEVFKNPAAFDWWYEAACDPAHANWARIFEGYNSTVDWPNATYWRELADAYPQAKIILTERDPDAWFDSTQATIFANDLGVAGGDEPFPRMAGKVVGELFDGRLHDRDHCIAVFKAHNARVRQTIPPDRLLVYEVAQGWGPLCDFLGVQVPDTPMPKVNSTEEFQANIRSGAIGPQKH